jgi:hypothetical protein
LFLGVGLINLGWLGWVLFSRKSGVSSSFLPEKMNRLRITRDTGLRGKMN